MYKTHTKSNLVLLSSIYFLALKVNLALNLKNKPLLLPGPILFSAVEKECIFNNFSMKNNIVLQYINLYGTFNTEVFKCHRDVCPI